MEVVEATQWRTWAEIGRWHGVVAELRLEFEESPRAERGERRVRAVVTVTGRAWQRPATWALARLAPYAVRHDLDRAARTL